MKKLELHSFYTREEVHDILSPNTIFTKSRGPWGIWGIVQIANSNDFVLMMTAGTVIGEHEFDEGFTEDGLLRWQSQPKNTLKTEMIQSLINHDETTNNVYLFYRKNKKDDYCYLGLLKYLSHDEDSGQGMEPVNFNWQLMNWPISDEIIDFLNIKLEPGLKLDKQIQQEKFIVTDAPQKKVKLKREGVKKDKFKNLKIFNNPEKDKKLKEIGDSGEEYVLEYEKERLTNLNKPELIKKIKHVASINDTAGYDILSYNEDGTERFIEVKTTKGPEGTDFFISPNELKFSKDNKDNFYIYRVYEFIPEKKFGKMYITKGDVEENFNLTPLQYKVSL
jgi:hypothetical protein